MLGHATRHCLARLTDFGGRTSREVYQPFVSLVTMPVIALVLFLSVGGLRLIVDGETMVVHGAGADPGLVLTFGIVLLLVLGATALVAAATVRRLHDVGRSGWWYAFPPCCVLGFLLVAMPGLGAEDQILLAFPLRIASSAGTIALMVFLRQPGQRSANRYGPPPDDWTDRDAYRSEVERVDARFAAALARRSERGSEPELPPASPSARTFGRRGL